MLQIICNGLPERQTKRPSLVLLHQELISALFLIGCRKDKIGERRRKQEIRGRIFI